MIWTEASAAERSGRPVRLSTLLGLSLVAASCTAEPEDAPFMMAPPAFGGAGTMAQAGTMGGAGMPAGAAGTGVSVPTAGTDGAVVPPNAGSGAGVAGMAGADAAGAGGVAGMAPVVPMGEWNDPGPEPFVLVPEADVAAECKLDINMLKASGYRNGAVFRYGKLCYSNGSIDSRYGVFSVTKTVAGTVMAAAYWDTCDNDRRILPSDPVSEWGGSGSTRISEYAGMVAGLGSGRTWGSHSFAYDTLGSNLRVTGGPMENSLSQGSVSGATRGSPRRRRPASPCRRRIRPNGRQTSSRRSRRRFALR
jgi:hypothetical protein